VGRRSHERALHWPSASVHMDLLFLLWPEKACLQAMNEFGCDFKHTWSHKHMLLMIPGGPAGLTPLASHTHPKLLLWHAGLCRSQGLTQWVSPCLGTGSSYTQMPPQVNTASL
jgi:hypothetical protein